MIREPRGGIDYIKAGFASNGCFGGISTVREFASRTQLALRTTGTKALKNGQGADESHSVVLYNYHCYDVYLGEATAYGALLAEILVPHLLDAFNPTRDGPYDDDPTLNDLLEAWKQKYVLKVHQAHYYYLSFLSSDRSCQKKFLIQH
ncbi:hypothetical protein ACU8KH_01558 [Lachancea thermotolerans]